MGNSGFKDFVGELEMTFTDFHADRRGKPPAATHLQLCGAKELEDLKAFWFQTFNGERTFNALADENFR